MNIRCHYVAVPRSSGNSTREVSRNWQPTRRPWNRGPATASALVASSDQNNKQTCVDYSQPHPSTQCAVVTSIQKRKEILKTSGRCFVCSRRNHIGRNCRSGSRCNKCHSRHHSSICDVNEMSRSSTTPAVTATRTMTSQMKEQEHQPRCVLKLQVQCSYRPLRQLHTDQTIPNAE